MSVTLIGLGLGDEKDITVRGLEAIKACDALFLEAYTSVIGVPKEQLEAFYEKEIKISDREDVEMRADEMLEMAEQGKKVGFLVVGDPLWFVFLFVFLFVFVFLFFFFFFFPLSF